MRYSQETNPLFSDYPHVYGRSDLFVATFVIFIEFGECDVIDKDYFILAIHAWILS